MRLAETIVQRNAPPLMPQVVVEQRPSARPDSPAPLRRRKAPEAAASPWRARVLNGVLVFVSLLPVVVEYLRHRGGGPR